MHKTDSTRLFQQGYYLHEPHSLGRNCQGDYIIGAMKNFLKALHLKRPNLVPEEGMFHWDNQKGSAVFGKKNIQQLSNPPYSCDWPQQTISCSPG
jgi:hypothetical protein